MRLDEQVHLDLAPAAARDHVDFVELKKITSLDVPAVVRDQPEFVLTWLSYQMQIHRSRPRLLWVPTIARQ